MTSSLSNVACAAWQDLALGSGTGSAVYSECGPDTVAISTNAVTGPGATSDNQHIVYHELCGNGEIIAKVAGITNSGYAGLFVRESSAAGARKGAIMTQKGSQVFRQIRLTTNGITAQASYMASGHQWLKLTRSGTQVMGSWSTNGSTWNMAFLTSLSMTDCVVMGMFAYSGNSNTTITATFTDISIVQSDSIPATAVSFADSSLTAQSGDTVEICVELQNPCYCSPFSVDVSLASDSLPHLAGFAPQTLTFEPGDTVQCFSVVLSAAIIGSQVHTENRWQGSGGAVYGVLGDFAQLYPFIVDANGSNPNGDSEFKPASVSPTEWFDDTQNPNQQTVCAPESCEIDGLVADSPDSKRIASGDIDAGDYTQTIVWELQRYLYRQLQGWNGQDSVIQAFMAASAGNTIGDFQAIDEAIEAMFNADTAEIATLKANLDMVIAQLDSLLSIDRILVNTSALEVPALIAQREVLVDSLFSLAQMNKVLAEAIEENRVDAAAAAGTGNAGITTTQDFEENEQTVNEVYLSWVEKGWQNLTGTEKAALEVVALQCPLLGGNAVYRARSLLSAAKGTLVSYDDSTACAGNEALIAPPPASTLTLNSEQELSVFPNPANDVVILTWRAPIVHSGTIRLYDSYGRQTRYIALGAGLSIQPVNIRDLYSGIYILRVELDGRTYTKKIAVKH